MSEKHRLLRSAEEAQIFTRAITHMRKLVAAWESLPGGNHSPQRVEEWLVNDMKPEIDSIRDFLAKLEGRKGE